jgi:hypothetical protein
VRPDTVRCRERQVGRVAEVRQHAAVQAPLHAQLTGRVVVGLDDLRFDLDLRLGLVEVRQQVLDFFDALRRVPDDEHVRALIDVHVAALRDDTPLFEELLHGGRGRVVQSDPRVLRSGAA